MMIIAKVIKYSIPEIEQIVATLWRQLCWTNIIEQNKKRLGEMQENRNGGYYE